MKILITSDTHGFHHQLDYEECDLFIHTGDFSNSPDRTQNFVEVCDFVGWLKDFPAKHKVVIPGNHDTCIENQEAVHKDMFLTAANANLLVHEELEVDGIKIFGSPYTPTFGSDRWVYNKSRHKLGRYWEQIPENTDLLLTHGPPKGILDLTDDRDTGKPVQVGCNALTKAVHKVQPLIHAFGHIHSERNFPYNFGVYESQNTKFVNSSYCWTMARKFNDYIGLKL